jgi:glyoxylase-like metal-dependent hydrolase (beta-lactamase superfamily II)
MFRAAHIVIGAKELAWSMGEAWGTGPVPELYMRELDEWPTLHVAENGKEVMPGVTAHLAPGHTPGHLVYVYKGRDRDIVFTGDAAKNRAELLSRKGETTYDAGTSRASIEMIWELWRRREGSILVPGHDLPMTQDKGKITYLGKRDAKLTAWFGENLEETTLFDLSVG